MRLQNVLKIGQLAVTGRLDRNTDFAAYDAHPTVFAMVDRASRNSDSIIGRRALAAKVRMEISDYPHEYVRASLAVDENQFLVLMVSNTTPVDVEGVRVRLNYTGRDGAVRSQYHTLSRSLGSRRKRRIRTRVGPIRNPATLQHLSLDVVSARTH